MVRYLVGKVALPAALVNFVVNLLAGWALFAPGRVVPMEGSPGIAADTLAGGFLIGLFTVLLAPAGARLEARAGRVVGWGWRMPWLGWCERHPVWTAIAGGLAAALVLAAPVVWLWSASGAHPLERDDFVVAKAAVASGFGVVAALAATLVVIAAEPDASRDERWLRPAPPLSSDGPSYPCQYFDKGGFAVTDRAHGCSATPTWHLVVRGDLAPAHVRAALADLLSRYPSLRTRVRALDGAAEHATRFCYAHDPAITADTLLAVADLRGQPPDALAVLLAEHHDRFLDVFVDPPLTLTLAISDDDARHLIFRQHHAIADGRAFIEALTDFAAYLEAARRGVRPADIDLAPVPRRDELEALGLPPRRRRYYTWSGGVRLIATRLAARVHPLVPLAQNRSHDYTGANGTVHRLVPEAALAGWKERARAAGASTNSYLTAALFLANQRWHQARGLTCGWTKAALVMETRPRGGGFRSFANHLAILDAHAELGHVHTLADLAGQIQRQLDDQRRRELPLRRVLIERFFVGLLPLAALKREVFDAPRLAHNLDFSNLIALDFPALGGDGWSVEDVFITTPVVPRTGIVLTVIRYRGRLCFNFNHKASAIARAEVESLADHFEAVLEVPAPGIVQ